MVEATEAERAKVIGRLSGEDKWVSSKYHYDAHGSGLFEEITELDEYYLTRTERAMLQTLMPDLVAEMAPRTLVELGAGNAEKSRIVLEAMIGARGQATFVPIDVSGDFLRQTAATLRREYDALQVHPLVADILDTFTLEASLPRPRWVALLGSTIGNFDEPHAIEVLRHVSAVMSPDDRFLLGADLRAGPEKPVEVIEAAYNDAEGVTARFSLNILNVLNDTFGSDFDPDGFRHRSVYSVERGRIETSLVSVRDQTVTFPGEAPISIANGEAIRSEISSKYDRPTIETLFARADLEIDRWMTDPRGLYALVLGRPGSPVG